MYRKAEKENADCDGIESEWRGRYSASALTKIFHEHFSCNKITVLVLQLSTAVVKKELY